MFKKIAFVLVVIVAVFIMVAALQPAQFTVVRSARMSAPPAAIFTEVNDFHRWAKWSPWEHLDPAMQKSYEGAAAGKGAVYTWSGNNQVGKGRMEITDSQPADLVRINLDFLAPFKASNVTEFTFKPEGGQTTVQWVMTGRKNFLAKAMCLFMNMDKMVGGDFEKGLSQMKTVVESAPKPAA